LFAAANGITTVICSYLCLSISIILIMGIDIFANQGGCSTYGGDEKCVQNFNWET
jgi:hypothetical protein